MTTQIHSQPHVSSRQLEDWTALSGGALLFLYGAARRDRLGVYAAVAAAPLLYRGLTGAWPFARGRSTDTRTALSGDRGLHVRESIRIDKPVEEVYAFWRRLDNLPRFMTYLESVSEAAGTGRSHWVALGPGDVRVEWDAEIINEIANQLIAWRSLPDSDIVTAGSVNFDRLHVGRATQITVNLQYSPPGGRGGAAVAWLFDRAPSQTIREDLRRLKRLLEGGSVTETS